MDEKPQDHKDWESFVEYAELELGISPATEPEEDWLPWWKGWINGFNLGRHREAAEQEGRA